MRVVAVERFTFFYELVSYTVEAGQEIDGAAGAHLWASNAPVRQVDEPDVEPDIEPSAPVEVPNPDDFDVATAKIDDVIAWVAGDPERAKTAHAAETAKGDKARSTLLGQLAEITAT